jgi:hypothetical protein
MNKFQSRYKTRDWSSIFKCVVVGAILSVTVVLVITQIKDHYTDDDDPMLLRVKSKIASFEPRVNDAIFHRGDKSYTINKKHVYMCLKDENDDYYNENMLMYVALHELAHVFCSDVQHTPQFKKIFADLLQRAQVAGVYDHKKPMVENYCNYTS